MTFPFSTSHPDRTSDARATAERPDPTGLVWSRSRWALRLELGFFLAMAVAGLVFWYNVVIEIPISFWGFPWDWPVMSLAQAVNIDFWLREPGHRALSQAQYYQPGLWFQFASFAMYRATSGSGSPRELFDTVLRHPEHFWAVYQAAPLLLTLVGLILLWRYCRDLTPLARCAVVSCYFVSLASLQYGTYEFFNESFTLPLASLFFPLGLAVLAPGQRRPLLNIFLCGLAASGLYLHKMNYVVWPAALIPALMAAAWAHPVSWRDAALRAALLVAGIVSGVLLFGYLLLGRQGLLLMLDAHKTILLGSGIYGSGAKTFVSFDVLLGNLATIWTTDRWTMLFLAMCTVLALWQFARRRRDVDWLRRCLPEAVFLYGAAGVMVVAVLKHFQPYYVVSFVAVFPFLVAWLARAGVRWGAPAAVLLTLIGLWAAVPDGLMQKKASAVAEAGTRSDREVILARPLPPDRLRLWMYRSVDPACGRLFLLSFIGIYDLMKETVAVQGPELFMSPWHSSLLDTSGRFADMKDLPWQMIVVDKGSLGWIDKSAHPWFSDPAVTRTDLSQVVLFERK